MTQEQKIVFHSGYEFSDYNILDQEDLGTYVIWEMEKRLGQFGLDIPVEDHEHDGHAPYTRGLTLPTDNLVLFILEDAIKSVRNQAEAGEI